MNLMAFSNEDPQHKALSEFRLVNGVVQATFRNGKDLPESVAAPLAVLAADRWYHLAMSRTLDGIVTLYIDGLEVARAQLTVTMRQLQPTDFDRLDLGALYFASGDAMMRDFFDGYMDDVRLYDYVLTAEEIFALGT